MNERLIAAASGLIVGATVVAILTMVLPPTGGAAQILLDRSSNFFPYPFTIQNLMWLVFFVGIGELVVRLSAGRREERQVSSGLLPEEPDLMLTSKDLGPFYQKVRKSGGPNDPYINRIILRTILQFQSSKSIDQANSLLNSSLDLFMHEIDLKYNFIRYITWLIPTLGFVGTVAGIALALAGLVNPPAGIEPSAWMKDPLMLRGVTDGMGTAFYTTLLALVQAAILVFLLHVAQAREELALNQAGQYCLDNLINRLYERQERLA